MTREEVSNLALSKIDGTKCMILELITGFGKSKLAINLINHICDKVYKHDSCPTEILILVAKTVHKQTWNDEIKKWGGIKSDYITIECYESLKNYKNHRFDVIVCDEAQHLSPKRLEILKTINIEEALICLSATLKKEMKEYFKTNYEASIISCGLREAVENKVLPEPTVYLIPLHLDIYRFTYKTKKYGKDIITSQKGYYDCLSLLIDYYKSKFLRTRSERIQRIWLSAAGKRLKWLSEQKEEVILNLLEQFKNEKVLTFCNNIEQSKRLGRYNITSKNKESKETLNKFNNNQIKHITAVNILNEGVNLTDCQIGIFCNLNSSEIITKQRCGRLLRHKKPIIIIPYYKHTREEELVIKMIEEYKKESIININNIKNIKL